MLCWQDIISQVDKPGRYLGNEINAVHKDLDRVKTKLALIFPDMYELGMSHLGLKILYHLLNRREDVAAERGYAPGLDMEDVLRREKMPLTSLESHLPLKDFDILGITLPYEMGYSNVLNILDLARIPLMAKDRDDRWPLVIGGGTCAANPEPLTDFFDAFVLGDGEEVVLEFVDAYQTWRDSGAGKQELLSRLAKIDGIYVPSLFEVSYKADGTVCAITPKQEGYTKVRRRIVADLDNAFFPIKGITPHLDVVHDRLTMEIARGCVRGCRFCQAGMTYRPRRQRSPRTISRLIEQSLAATGYEEVSLSSLSTGDYSPLPRLLEGLSHYPEQKVAVSLPSLRPGTLKQSLVKYIKQVRQTGFTIAPEAGSERLRSVINKGITEEEILRTAGLIFENGWQGLKLYFMIGLPTEEEADLEGIAGLVKKIGKLAKQLAPKQRVKINVALSGYVPKAHTPFQWVSQATIAELESKQAFIREKIPRKNCKLKWHDPYLSHLEGIMSRGDRRLGAVILRAWQNGARFDQWSEHFNYAYWEEAFKHCGVDPEFYTKRQRSLDEILPWRHLDMGISSEFLKREYHKSLQAELSPKCSETACQDCGISRRMECSVLAPAPEASGEAEFKKTGQVRTDKLLRFRVRFSKLGDIRFLAHLDIMRLFTRAFRRADLPVSYSQGFHPHPRLTFSAPLSIGLESEAEYVDFELFEYMPPQEFARRLREQLPEGIQLGDVCQVPRQAPSLTQHDHLSAYSIWVPRRIWANGRPLPEDIQSQHRRRIADFMRQEQILVPRKRKNKVIDAKPLINAFKLTDLNEEGLFLELMIKASPAGSVKPQEIVQNLYDIPGSDINILQIKRLSLWLKNGQHFISPMGVAC